MRLLNTKTHELQEFHALPEHYAILSHTWGTEEVTYQHLLAGTGRKRQGWKKLEGACALAAKDGWELLWMDTCCIDKTDSVDLSEAINSMYRWYQASSVCYAYLEDVELVDGSPVSTWNDSAWPEKIKSRREFQHYRKTNPTTSWHLARQQGHLCWKGIFSRWFTRGWTLQELLAPEFLLFLDKEWSIIGGRRQWSAQIQAMTAIDHRYLSGERSIHDKNKCPAATKFGWASLRTTSRPEDQIYCLIGLLNVNMSLLYGEGAQNAFHRLQRKIIKRSNDESILAWQWPNSTPMQWDNILAPTLDFFQWLTGVPHRELNYELELYAFEADRDEFVVTNKGLKVNVPLMKAIVNSGQRYKSTDASPSNERSGMRDPTFHLRLNCRLVVLEKSLSFLPITIPLNRDPVRNEVFVRHKPLLNFNLPLPETHKSRTLYLKHDADVRYSQVQSQWRPRQSYFRIEVADGISIPTFFTFEGMECIDTQNVRQAGTSALNCKLDAWESVLFRAAVHCMGQVFELWVCLGCRNASPWVTLADLNDFEPRYLGGCHIWDCRSNTVVGPRALINHVASLELSTSFRAELKLYRDSVQIAAHIQPCGPGYTDYPSVPGNVYLLRLTWTSTTPDPHPRRSPMQIVDSMHIEEPLSQAAST